MASLNLVSESVKTPHSTYRQAQAEATRVRIADAAQLLFARDGYGATSMEGIAKEAGVGTRTVYAAFAAKREILSAICERWLAKARARELAREVLEVADPMERIRRSAGWLTTLYSTDFDVVRILESALDEDQATRDLLHAKLRGRNRIMDGLIASLESHLSVPLEEAQSIFRAYAAAGVYGELVAHSGWSPARFEEWLAETLTFQLTGRSRGA